MAQPTYENLFGSGAAYNSGTSKLEIPLTALATSGLDATDPTALETLAAIVKNAHSWLSSNTDEEVMATSEINIFAPSTRNDQTKTQYGYTLDFFGNYTAPTFDPDEV